MIKRNISLKWRIFLFYVVFGFIPLWVVFYLSVVAYTRSINSMTEKYVGELVQRTADQTDALSRVYLNYLDILVKSPFVQLSFLQYPYGGQMGTVQDKLELFRLNTNSFDRITLYTNDGHMVTTTPAIAGYDVDSSVIKELIIMLSRHEAYHQVIIDRDRQAVDLFKRVYDYRDSERAVGVVKAAIALGKLLESTRQLQLGKGVEKAIVNASGMVVYREASPKAHEMEPMKEFTAGLPFLDWRMFIRLPESLLLKDVDRLTHKIWAFVGFVALVAIGASLIFSRLAIRPLQQIIAGTREFANGNFDYRIHIPYGVETKRVAKAFNAMADELNKRQTELIQADKLASLGLLSAGIAHEVGNPLAGLKTSAQVLVKRCPTGETRELAEGISKEVDRLSKIVTDLLHFARPRPADKQVCDVKAIVEKSLKLLNAEIRSKNVTVINRTDTRKTWAAPDQMVQVMINLLLNAITAVEPGIGRIRVETLPISEAEFEMRIEDNGRGIPAQQLSRIFDPFFSLSPEGSGLGLSIVHTLAGQNNVRIHVESQEGASTTFRMIFKTYHEEAVHG